MTDTAHQPLNDLRFVAALSPTDAPLRELKRRVAIHKQKGCALKAGVSLQFLNDVLRGRREPSGALLEWLGFERVVTYRKKRV